MKKLDILIDSAIYALYFFFTCLVCMLAEWFASRIITLFIEISPFALSIVRVIIYTVGVCAVLGIALFKEGYRSARANVGETVISVALASVTYFLFCLLFSFEAFCAGGVKYVTLLLKYGSSLTLSQVEGGLTRLDPIGIFFLHIAVYGAVMTVCKQIGADKRIDDRRGINTVEDDENYEQNSTN
jgi:hypothetical protein